MHAELYLCLSPKRKKKKDKKLMCYQTMKEGEEGMVKMCPHAIVGIYTHKKSKFKVSFKFNCPLTSSLSPFIVNAI